MASARFPRHLARNQELPDRKWWISRNGPIWLAGGGRTDHPLDLVGGVTLSADPKQRRRGGQIDRIHDTLDFGGNCYVFARAVLAGGGHGVGTGRPLHAVIALAVPDETGITLFQCEVAGIGGLSRRIRDRDRRGGVAISLKIPGCRFVELCRAAVDGDRAADIDQRLRRLRALFD